MTTTLVAPPIYRTSIGKKVIMAASGLVLLLFVIGHMIGNLKAFLSAKELDAYAEFLRRMGEPIFPHTVLLWIIRVVGRRRLRPPRVLRHRPVAAQPRRPPAALRPPRPGPGQPGAGHHALGRPGHRACS